MLEVVKRVVDAVFRPHYYAGSVAEDVFERQALDARPPWVVERIPQSKEAMQRYRVVAGRSVKRADFIVRNCRGAEVEVKCKTRYTRGGDEHYLLTYSELKRHEAMRDSVTHAPVVFAFYERDGRRVLSETLRMVDLAFLLQTSDYRSGKLYVPQKRSLMVPFRYMRPGFKVLEILSRR